MSVVIDGTTGITSPDVDSTLNGLAYPDASSMGFRNRIINGDMRIDQRNNGAAVTAISAYIMDRWQIFEDTNGAASVQRVSDAPVGFTNAARVTTTTASGSLSATQRTVFFQIIEGFNVADFAWGTASAQPVTISFWTKSSLTGSFGGSILNGAANRSYPFAYTINAVNTWEYKTITIPGDTSGTWITDNGSGLQIVFGLGAGSTFSGTAGAWAGTSISAPTGSVNILGTLNATWQITGVQLEAGSVATPFERRPYGTELALCQRYYSMNGLGNGTAISSGAYDTHPFPVTMRAAPTITKSVAGAIGVDEYAFYFLAPFTTTMSWTASAEL